MYCLSKFVMGRFYGCNIRRFITKPTIYNSTKSIEINLSKTLKLNYILYQSLTEYILTDQTLYHNKKKFFFNIYKNIKIEIQLHKNVLNLKISSYKILLIIVISFVIKYNYHSLLSNIQIEIQFNVYIIKIQ